MKKMKILSLLPLLLCCSAVYLKAQTRILDTFEGDNFGGPTRGIALNGKLYFSAWDAVHGRELWVSDGTPQGTLLMQDIYPGTPSSIDDGFDRFAVLFNGAIYFRADDGLNGPELWRCDGANTTLVADLSAGSAGTAFGSLCATQQYLYFVVNGTQLYRTDGTPGSAQFLKSFNSLTSLSAWNNLLFFAGDFNNSGYELWKSNGTVNGTQLVKDLNGAPGASLPINFHATPNWMYFMANTSAGWELWRTDGSNANTTQVSDCNPGPGNSVLDAYTEARMTHIGDTVYFAAHNGNAIRQLWKTDGTLSGTVQLSNLSTGIEAYCRFPVVDGKVLFAPFDAPLHYEYDPGNGQVSLGDYPFRYAFNQQDGQFQFGGNTMYYSSNDSLFGAEISRANGTPGGIARIAESFLINNWSPLNQAGFHRLLGVSGTKLIYSQIRGANDSRYVLFAHETSNLNACQAPVALAVAPVSSTAMHLIWGRSEGAGAYQVRFREQGNSAWDTVSTLVSYQIFASFDTTKNYLFQVRTLCSGGYSNWSDTVVYNPLYKGTGTAPFMLAERAEDSTVMRLYWLQSSDIQLVQFRYRPYGSGTWITTSNSNGYRRITGLLPNTLYEYNFRAQVGGVLQPWPLLTYYFVTGGSPVTVIHEIENDKPQLLVYPNPAGNWIYFKEERDRRFYILNTAGQMMLEGKCTDRIDISMLLSGSYHLVLQQNKKWITASFVKQ
jgi:ELWxxDGT repeat protein